MTSTCSIPAEFDDAGFEPTGVDRRLESGAGSARVKDDVVLGRNIAGFGEFHAERFGVAGAGRVDVGNRHMCSRNTLREVGDQQPDDAGSDDKNTVAWSRAGIPMGVERRFHIGCQYRTPRRHFCRNGQHVRFGDLEIVLMWMQCKDALADPFAGPGGDDAGG